MIVLIVEDHPTNRKLLRAQLEAEGHRVLDAGDGLEALEVMGRSKIDLVISDILMPNMDGFRLCHEIRRREAFAHMPFVLYTSTYNSPADRQLAETVGADRFVLKPAPTAVLLQAMQEACAIARGNQREPTSEHDENYVLKRYSEALVHKLEEKNADLEAALDAVRSAHQDILDLNADLEARVQRRTAQLETANRDLEAFAYSVSHDLRAPLRRIGAFAGILDEHKGVALDEEGRMALDAITGSVREMGQLIQDLLAFAKMGRMEMARTAVALDPLVEQVVAAMEAEAPGRRIEWNKDPLPVVWGDASMLRQVFVNLLGNAVKYTKPRDPAQIRISRGAGDGPDVVLCVSDNGVGFDPAHAGKLFGVFQRLHRADEFEGTGIGLAIVERVVSRHGGRIWADAAVNVGASFYFTLQAAAAVS